MIYLEWYKDIQWSTCCDNYMLKMMQIQVIECEEMQRRSIGMSGIQK
jgi:hypothetical protein